MVPHFQRILCQLFRTTNAAEGYHVFDPASQFVAIPAGDAETIQSLNAAFLAALAGPRHPLAAETNRQLESCSGAPEFSAMCEFYQEGLRLVQQELESVATRRPDLERQVRALNDWLSDPENLRSEAETQDRVWSVFYPEATGIRGEQERRIEQLRGKRNVTITQLNEDPLRDPASQVLFTSNVLLTVPSATTRVEELGFSDQLLQQLREACDEQQLYWYDHPIPIGTAAEANEVLYGLRELQSALEFEQDRGTTPNDANLTCALSVSVTHRGLQRLAKRYLSEEIERSGGFNNLDVFVFTEEDTQGMVDQVLVPAAEHYLASADARETFRVFGVDGHYGRHYSFLKAVLAFWNTLIDAEKKATFKIDLDQVFPQPELVAETNLSAFEHLATPLWGALGIDCHGQPVELGMIAGALVNERDIQVSLFTPDVRFPNRRPVMDECVFCSGLPQALSTAAEMMTRYDSEPLDGRSNCLHRVHVTGGTNGILVDTLCRFRPFTPTFIGRAEDQAYLLSALFGHDVRLAYAHQPGLIMRHDKEAFAQEAIAAAHVGKLIGDYERILYFSSYAEALTQDADAVKELIDPFTGSFISHIPVTVVYLRFALKCASLFRDGNNEQATQFARLGARRISDAIAFSQGDRSELAGKYLQERSGWNLYYDTLAAVREALSNNDSFALTLRERAEKIIAEAQIAR